MQIPSVAELQRMAAQICQGREDGLAGVAYSLCSTIRKFNDDITKIIMKFDDDITNNHWMENKHAGSGAET